MGPRSLCIKVPGKLMVAGEFAVLEPQQKLVVMAIDRYVYATITASIENQLMLEDLGLNGLHFRHEYQDIQVDTTDDRIDFVKQAMLTALNYLHEQSIIPEPFTLHVKSELDDESGKKYGLGSSAAVVTAVITAILTKHLEAPPSADLIFKLSAISHVTTQGNGSGADIAASTYGGMLAYTSFQAEWLLERLKEKESLTELVAENWTYLSVERVQLPENVFICMGWTGTPASTAHLVRDVLTLKKDSPKQFQQFIIDSASAVDAFLQGIADNDLLSLFAGINQNRQCLARIGKQAQVDIETPLLNKLAQIAKQFGGAGKLSGAGGGDCGIAFLPGKKHIGDLQKAWNRAGITPLSMNISLLGAGVISRKST